MLALFVMQPEGCGKYQQIVLQYNITQSIYWLPINNSYYDDFWVREKKHEIKTISILQNPHYLV